MNPDPTAALSDLEFTLLNSFQRDFPLLSRPFAVLARKLETTEAIVIASLQRLQDRGLVSRVGAVFQSNAIGASALAALAVPSNRLEEVARYINALPEVNHNYERDHQFNLWFVATAPSSERLQAVLHGIEAICKCGPILILPMRAQYHIDLGFDLRASPTQKFVHRSDSFSNQVFHTRTVKLSQQEQTLVAALQNGLPLVPRPFAWLGLPEPEAIALIARWLDDHLIKRLGVVVRHHELGYTANAMAVWDVPDDAVDQVGRQIAASGMVTLCYQRSRQLPLWRYNLFCMIHGKDRSEVKARVDALADACALRTYPAGILFSSRCFKQCGAHYAHPPEVAHG